MNTPKKQDSPLIMYCNILHDFGIASHEAVAFKQQRAFDADFQRQARVLERLLDQKNEVLDALRPDDTLPPA